jgi:hypothetical protein
MSDLSSNLFQTIDAITERRIASTAIDLTITGEITLLQNLDVGKYKVAYQGTTFDAYALDPMSVYHLGEEVYVLVPQGDFSSKKIILGKATYNDNVSYADREGMTNQWRTKGPNWLTPAWYWKNTDGSANTTEDRKAGIVVTNQNNDAAIGVGANWREYAFYRDGIPAANEQNYTVTRQDKTKLPSRRPGTTIMGNTVLTQVDKDFQNYGRQMDYIMVKANFETTFLNTHSTGEYGILVECYVDNPKYGVIGYDNEEQYALMSFRLGFGDFNGARYNYGQPTPQQAIFPVPRGVLKGLARVSLFQTDGWETDIQPVSIDSTTGNPDPNGTSYTFEVPPAKLVTFQNNVLATNIEIYWCEKVNLANRLFWLKLDTIKGTSLNNTIGPSGSWITSVPIQARLMYGGEDITTKESCKFVWFRQKYSALRDLAKTADVDEFGNTWASYLPENENGWAPISQMIKSPADDPILGENATYQLGTVSNRIFVPDPNFQDSLLVPIEEVPWEWKYMVVCYYNPNGGTLDQIQRSSHNDALIWDTEIISNTSTIHDFELPMASISDNLSDIFLRVRNNTLPWEEGIPFNQYDPTLNDPKRDWYCRWWVNAGQAYNAIQVAGDVDQQRFHKGRRKVNQFLLNEPVTFKAQIYGKKNPTGATPEIQVGDAAQVFPDPPSGGVPDMTLEYNEFEIANIERTIIPNNSAAVHVQFHGQTNHNYNSDGKIRLSDAASSQYNITAKITPQDESLADFSIEWLAPDGTALKELSADEIIAGTGYTLAPQISMLKDMWSSEPTDTNNQRVLHYKVSDTYDIDKVNAAENTFTLRIIFVNGVTQDVPCVISYTKAGHNGTQGSEWTAELWPCNATPSSDPNNVVGYTPWTQMIQDHPRPLVVLGDWNPTTTPTSGYTRNDNYRLFLRPFVRRNGEPIESLNEATRYTYKVFWDCRYPVVKAPGPRATASNGSFLRIDSSLTSGRLPTDLGRDGSLSSGTPYQRGTTVPTGDLYMQAYSHSLDREGAPYNGATITGQPTYGAMEIGWANRPNVNGVSFKDLNYSFVVKGRIEIYYDGVGVASITSFYGVDVVFSTTPLSFDNLDPSKIKTNWPREVLYSTSGVAPSLANSALTFLYGDSQYLSTTTEPFPMTAMPVNLTPNIQDLNISSTGLNIRGVFSTTATYRRTSGVNGVADVVTYGGYFFAVREVGTLPVNTPPDRLSSNDVNWRQISDLTAWKLLPKPFYFFEKTDNGALATNITTNTGKWPVGAAINPDFATWGTAVFIRPIVYYINQYANDSINGWDGKSIDLNETNGTLFAPTVGAGWKHPFTNTFSGVVMGIDKSQLKSYYDTNYGGFSKDNMSQNPYMTGLYGYQDGHNSFGIMENGTAFFGRADRGGRIIIDGYNAQIYGGSITEGRTGLDADMRNRMRLSFIDFGGIANSMDPDAAGVPGQTASYNTAADNYNNYVQTINWTNYNNSPTYRESVDLQLSTYRSTLNNIGNSPTPGESVGNMGGIVMGAFVVDQDLNTGANPSKNQWFGNFYNYFAPGLGSTVNPYALRFGGYFTGGSFSTPAIEIGSYEDWIKDSSGSRIPYSAAEKAFVTDDYGYHRGSDLIRHYTLTQIQDQGSYNNIEGLEIPGFRRFLVTYDGTLYAMNAFIKGNIIGSNIIGSQFFNAEGTFAVTEEGNLGIGKGYGLWTEEKVINGYSDKWSIGIPEVETYLMWNYLPETGKQRQDFLDGGFGFYTSNTGIVLCKEIHIAGGSINIGDFHVIGKTDSDSYKGDVVSYGTMYLVGRKGAMPTLGQPAVEAWGDFNLRGRLVNLGPVFLGAKTEKDRPGTAINGTSTETVPSSFNSPISIVPETFAAGTVNADPNLPVKIGIWPLYFRNGRLSDINSNNSWVTISGNEDTSAPTEASNNGYMPAFSWRPGSVEGAGGRGPRFTRRAPGNDYIYLSQHVVWRLDQLAMWSDGIIFTKKGWTGNPTDDTPLTFNDHGLLYFGWAENDHIDSGTVGSFTIKNVSKSAPSVIIETPGVFRITSGDQTSSLRGTVENLPPVNDIILQAKSNVTNEFPIGTQLVLQGGNGNAEPGIASLSGTSTCLIGKSSQAYGEFGTGPNELRWISSFITLNSLGFADPRDINDDLGYLIGQVPKFAESRIWAKATGMAFDGIWELNLNSGDWVLEPFNSTIRINRSWDGGTAANGMPVGIGDSTGKNFIGIMSGTIMLRSDSSGNNNSDSIHIVTRGDDNGPAISEVFLAGASNGGLVRLSAPTEISLGINVPGHEQPTDSQKGLVMNANEFKLTSYTPEQQKGIYARFA